MIPFITFYTPAFRRPVALAVNLDSVRAQTAVRRIEQVVLPDYAELGVVNGLYGRMPWYADAVRGAYVHILADDDALASPTVVAQVEAFAVAQGFPPVIVVRNMKGAQMFPKQALGLPPMRGLVDLGNYIVRRDVWQRHVTDYGLRYEGDFDHAQALHDAGHEFAACDLLFSIGAASGGRPELDY